MNILNETFFQLTWQLPLDWIFFAVQIRDPNIVGQIQKAFDHFIQTGQVWALLIGFGIGYMIRNLTSYG